MERISWFLLSALYLSIPHSFGAGVPAGKEEGPISHEAAPVIL